MATDAEDGVAKVSVGVGVGVGVALTAMLTVAVAVPPVASLPVMVYEVADCAAMGVPLITPVAASSAKPAGSGGLMV